MERSKREYSAISEPSPKLSSEPTPQIFEKWKKKFQQWFTVGTGTPTNSQAHFYLTRGMKPEILARVENKISHTKDMQHNIGVIKDFITETYLVEKMRQDLYATINHPKTMA